MLAGVKVGRSVLIGPSGSSFCEKIAKNRSTIATCGGCPTRNRPAPSPRSGPPAAARLAASAPASTPLRPVRAIRPLVRAQGAQRQDRTRRRVDARARVPSGVSPRRDCSRRPLSRRARYGDDLSFVDRLTCDKLERIASISKGYDRSTPCRPAPEANLAHRPLRRADRPA